MNLLITIFTFIFISFGASANDKTIFCNVTGYWKISSNFLGFNSLYFRDKGKWIKRCKDKGDEVFEDSAKCSMYDSKGNTKFVIDFIIPQFQWYNKNGKMTSYQGCLKK